MNNERLHAVAQPWEAHIQAPFPARLRGAEIVGLNIVVLDADTAGCVKTWLDNNGRLDAWRRDVIASCLDELNRVMPRLADQDEAAYYNRLRELTMLLHSDQSTPTQQ
jgi:hypothetical protein